MKRKTSVSGGNGNFRARMHLQFFAENADGGTDGAEQEQDDGAATGFTEGLSAACGDNQPAMQEQTGEDEPEGAENQRALESAAPPEQLEQAMRQAPPVNLTFNGAVTALPADAVQQVARALGGGANDVVTLLQKGMNYENKAAREMRVLEEYANAAGIDRNAYLHQLEEGLQTARLKSETDRVLEQYPGMAQQTAQSVAKQRMADAEQSRRQEQEQTQQRVRQTVNKVRVQAQMQAWDAYEQLSGVHRAQDIPPRVLELVQREGMDPTAAHWRFQSEQNGLQLQHHQKMNQNKRASTGSQRGAASDFADAFLSGLLN